MKRIDALLLDLYELTMAQVYFKHRRTTSATFDLFIRSASRPFYIACGIDEVLNYLENLKLTKEDLIYLKSLNIFEDEFLDYLRDFRFRGEVWAVVEPEVVFAQEPILRVSGNLIESQIIESAVLNKINLATTLATKAARVVLAAKERGVYDFGLRRTQGEEASLAIAKYSYICGVKGTSNVYAGFLYKIPVAGTMAHSFVMSFEREIESFLAFAKTLPTKSILLIDTYGVKQGLHSAIRAAKFLKLQGINILGIRLDSGNLAADAKYARKLLNKEGLSRVGIFASGDLDEYKIEDLVGQGAPIDAFGVGTNMGCSSDRPYSDVIYKLVEITRAGKRFTPTMKLSQGKATLPSRKQVFRTFSSTGIMKKDYIGLENEALAGKKLLKKLMQGGKRLYRENTLDEKRTMFNKKIKALPSLTKKAKNDYEFKVLISPKLSALTKKLESEIEKRSHQRIIFMDIDMQNDFAHKKGALYAKGSDKIIGNVKKLTTFARKNKILIVSSRDTHTSDDPEFKDFPPHCVAGTWGNRKLKQSLLSRYTVLTIGKDYSHAQLEGFVKNFNQIIWEKETIDVFSNPNLSRLLEVVFPDKVYLYGLITEYCIKTAIEGLLKMGFSVTLIYDAIHAISKTEKRRLFSQWKKKGVKFTTTKLALRDLSVKIK